MFMSVLLLVVFSPLWSIWGCLCLFGKENWTRRGDLSCHRAEEGKSSRLEGQPVPRWALLGLLALQPAFLGFFFTLSMSWSLKTGIYLQWEHRQNIISRKCDFSCSADVGPGHCVLLGAVLWPWLDLSGNKWIAGDCHWKSGRCLSQTSLGYFSNLCQYFSVCIFVLAFSRSF